MRKPKLFAIQRSLVHFFSDFAEFLGLFFSYVQRKFVFLGREFEIFKRFIVHSLIARRGRFTRPFLHFGVGSFLAFGIVVAPVLATTYPMFSQGENFQEVLSPSAVLTSATEGDPILSTEISPKPRDRIIVYTVEKGDTLSTIAAKFDISIDALLWENGLKANSTLSVGQTLRILPVSGVAHKVLKGDTVYTIAKKYDTDPQKIVNFPFNDFADPETFALVPGQVLIVPDGSPPAVKPVTPRALPRFIAQSDIAPGIEGFIWPTSGNVTQRPVWYHMAVDISNRAAPAVGAVKKGVVTYADCVRGGYGCHVIIDHGDGVQTLYGHLSQIGVASGTVEQGQVIGKMGSTGRSTGTHLHFEIRKNGVLLNPLNFLK